MYGSFVFWALTELQKDGAESDEDNIMADGCWPINLSALLQSKRFALDRTLYSLPSVYQLLAIRTQTFPLVVQGRIAGAKGLWLLHTSPEHRIDTEPLKIVSINVNAEEILSELFLHSGSVGPN